MPATARRARPSFPFALPLPLLPGRDRATGGGFGHPFDALPAAINHLLAAEPWARSALEPHAGKVLDVVVGPWSIRLAVAADGTVLRAAADAIAATTVTVPVAALPRIVAGGPTAALRDLRIDGDAEFAQTVSTLMKGLRWDVEEDLSKVVGDAASHRIVGFARQASDALRRSGERATANVTEYLVDEDPQLVRPRAVTELGDGIRRLRDDLARLEKRVDRLTTAPGR